MSKYSNRISLLVLALLITITNTDHSCSNYDSYFQCKTSSDTDLSAELYADFQTPLRGSPEWKSTYEDLGLLTGYVSTKYSPNYTEATITFHSNVNQKLIQNYDIIYSFGTTETTSNVNTITHSDTVDYSMSGMPCKITLLDKDSRSKLTEINLDPLFFIWDNPLINDPPEYENGRKGVIVEMFGWPFNDIAQECEFLGKAGYLGVKVYPPQEAVITFDSPESDGQLNPWYFIYQPVSYKLTSRHGTIQELKQMTYTCRQHGVRIYIDSVINHMSGIGNDISPEHRNKETDGTCTITYAKEGTAGLPFFTFSRQFQNNTNTNKMPAHEFPGVPYTQNDFHCYRDIIDEYDGFQLDKGYLFGLTDLKTESEYVRRKIADYFTSLLSIGASGFRIDAARNVSPKDQAAIYAYVKENMGGSLPTDFLVYLQLWLGLENEQKDLLMCDKESDFSFSYGFVNEMKQLQLTDSEIESIKIITSDFPRYFPACGELTISQERTVVGMEALDDQTPGVECRDLGDAGTVFVVEKNKDKHKAFTKKYITDKTYNFKIKLIMSSYSYRESIGAFSYPDGLSDCNACETERCKKGCTKSMPYVKAYNPDSTGYDTIDENGNWIEGMYTRVHRDMDVVSAVREWMGLTEVNEEYLYGDTMLTGEDKVKYYYE